MMFHEKKPHAVVFKHYLLYNDKLYNNKFNLNVYVSIIK